MKNYTRAFFLLPLLVLLACNKKPVAYTFSGEVNIVNKCNLIAEDLPERVKVTYILEGKKGKATGEQLIDVHKLDNLTVRGKFSITVNTELEVSNYTAVVTRPNGKNICIMLPCSSARTCKGENSEEHVLPGNSTSVTDTLNLTCSCSL